MPLYQYKVRNASGNLISGVNKADSKRILIQRLRSLNYYIVNVKEVSKYRLPFISFFKRKSISATALALFCRQLATMLRAGLDVVSCMSTLAEQAEYPEMGRILKEITSDIEGGSSLTEALSKYPKMFSELFVSSVEVGEETGNLDQILERMADYMEREARMKAQIVSAAFYPTIIILFAVGVMVLVLVYFVPVMKDVYRQFAEDTDLPLPTELLIKISDLFKENWLFLLVFVVLTFLAVMLFRKSDFGRYSTDKLILKTPIVGQVALKINISRFAQTFETMMMSGMPILRAFQIMGQTIRNKVIARVMEEVRDNISRGGTIAKPLGDSEIFPPLITKMISVGEETGDIDAMLREIARLYEQQVEHAIERMMAMIQPLLMISIGIGVFLIAAAAYMPIFTLAKSM